MMFQKQTKANLNQIALLPFQQRLSHQVQESNNQIVRPPKIRSHRAYFGFVRRKRHIFQSKQSSIEVARDFAFQQTGSEARQRQQRGCCVSNGDVVRGWDVIVERFLLRRKKRRQKERGADGLFRWFLGFVSLSDHVTLKTAVFESRDAGQGQKVLVCRRRVAYRRLGGNHSNVVARLIFAEAVHAAQHNGSQGYVLKQGRVRPQVYSQVVDVSGCQETGVRRHGDGARGRVGRETIDQVRRGNVSHVNGAVVAGRDEPAAARAPAPVADFARVAGEGPHQAARDRVGDRDREVLQRDRDQAGLAMQRHEGGSARQTRFRQQPFALEVPELDQLFRRDRNGHFVQVIDADCAHGARMGQADVLQHLVHVAAPVKARLDIVHVQVTGAVTDQAEISANGQADAGGANVPWQSLFLGPVSTGVLLESFVKQLVRPFAASLEVPGGHNGMSVMQRHHAVPLALARRLHAEVDHRRELLVAFGQLQVRRGLGDGRLAHALVLRRVLGGSDAQGAVVARRNDGRAVVETQSRRRQSVARARSQQPAGRVRLVKRPDLDRVVAGVRQQQRLPGQERQGGHARLVRFHDADRAFLVQVPHADLPVVGARRQVLRAIAPKAYARNGSVILMELHDCLIVANVEQD